MTKLLTLLEIAALMDRSPHAIRQLMTRGVLPHSKIAGRLYCDEAELTCFLELRRRVTAEAAVAKKAA